MSWSCSCAFARQDCALTLCAVAGALPCGAVCLQAEEAESCPRLLCGGRAGVLSRPPRDCRWAPLPLSEGPPALEKLMRKGA